MFTKNAGVVADLIASTRESMRCEAVVGPFESLSVRHRRRSAACKYDVTVRRRERKGSGKKFIALLFRKGAHAYDLRSRPFPGPRRAVPAMSCRCVHPPRKSRSCSGSPADPHFKRRMTTGRERASDVIHCVVLGRVARDVHGPRPGVRRKAAGHGCVRPDRSSTTARSAHHARGGDAREIFPHRAIATSRRSRRYGDSLALAAESSCSRRPPQLPARSGAAQARRIERRAGGGGAASRFSSAPSGATRAAQRRRPGRSARGQRARDGQVKASTADRRRALPLRFPHERVRAALRETASTATSPTRAATREMPTDEPEVEYFTPLTRSAWSTTATGDRRKGDDAPAGRASYEGEARAEDTRRGPHERGTARDRRGREGPCAARGTAPGRTRETGRSTWRRPSSWRAGRRGARPRSTVVRHRLPHGTYGTTRGTPLGGAYPALRGAGQRGRSALLASTHAGQPGHPVLVWSASRCTRAPCQMIDRASTWRTSSAVKTGAQIDRLPAPLDVRSGRIRAQGRPSSPVPRQPRRTRGAFSARRALRPARGANRGASSTTTSRASSHGPSR